MKDKLNTLWELLREVNDNTLLQSKFANAINLDPAEYRLDDLGAIIKKSEHGKQTEFGWTVDHIFPISKGGDDDIRNLQLLHWQNNELKGDSFPTFSWSTSFNPDNDSIENISKPRPMITFRETFIESLSDLYPTILNHRVSSFDSILL